MIRVATKSLASRIAVAMPASRSTPRRFQSGGGGGSSGGGGGKLIAFTTTALVSAGVGTVAYASVSDEFRTTVEETIPGSKDLLDAVLGGQGTPAPVKKAEVAPPSKMKIQVTSTPPMPEIEKPPAPAPPAKQVKESEEKVTTTPSAKKVIAEKANPSKVTPPEKTKEEKAQKEASDRKAEIVALEMALDEACKDMKVKVRKAVEASQGSIDATRHHMALVKALMEDTSPKDEKKAWNEIFDAATKKAELLKETDASINEAKDALGKTIRSIETGRKSGVTQHLEALKSADDIAGKALSELELSITSLDSIQKEAKLIDEYRSLVEEGRQQFQKEIEALLPGAKISGGSLSEDELNIFMTHAYR